MKQSTASVIQTSQPVSIAKKLTTGAVKTVRPTKTAAKRTNSKRSPQPDPKAQKTVNKKTKVLSPEPTRAEDEAVIISEPAFLTQAKTAICEVSFDDAMRITPLLGKVGLREQSNSCAHLASHGCDVLAAALAGATLVIEKGTYIARFSKEGMKLLNAKELKFMKDAAGNRLPTLVGSANKAAENARLLGPLAKGTRIAANLTVAAVTIAHIVSGADIAKKINKLDAKVDLLVAGRRIDQLARIEGVYRQAREILHLEQNSYTQWELHRMGRELFEVRSAWRREIGHHVGQLQRTEESENWLVGFFQGLNRKGKDEKVASAVSARDAELQLISGSIAIHLALSQAAGTLDIFLQVSLPDEIAELEGLRGLIHERRHFIHEKHPELRDSVSSICSQLDDITRIYRPMVVPRIDSRRTY